MDDQKVEQSQLPCQVSSPETDFVPESLKEMPDIQQKLKEEEKINLDSCMGHLKNGVQVKSGLWPHSRKTLMRP